MPCGCITLLVLKFLDEGAGGKQQGQGTPHARAYQGDGGCCRNSKCNTKNKKINKIAHNCVQHRDPTHLGTLWVACTPPPPSAIRGGTIRSGYQLNTRVQLQHTKISVERYTPPIGGLGSGQSGDGGHTGVTPDLWAFSDFQEVCASLHICMLCFLCVFFRSFFNGYGKRCTSDIFNNFWVVFFSEKWTRNCASRAPIYSEKS